MANLNLKVNCIINKYFPQNYNEKTMNTINFIGKIINSNCLGKNFAIWGAGEHTENLYKYFSQELKDAKFIIDNDTSLLGKKIFGFDVIRPNEVKKYKLDVILISSYASAKVIEEQIADLGLNCRVINFYSELKKNKIELKGAFFSNPSIYVDLYNEKINYINYNDDSKREVSLKRIIYLYLKIRDFYNAEIYIKKYLKNNFKDNLKFNQLLLEINQLLCLLSFKLQLRKGKDIMLMFLDAIRAKDIYDYNPNMKYLNSILKESVYFTNAYSPSIVTYESVPSMFSNSMPFTNYLYKRKTVREEECNFIQVAKKHGYKIKIYSLNYWNIIDGENIEYGEESNYASETLWNALCDIVESEEKNTLYLLYFWQETHPPHIGGNHSVSPQSHVTPFTCNDDLNQTQIEYIKQYKESLHYIDNQLQFYFNIMGNNYIKLIFSDHGQVIDKALSNLIDIGTLAGWHTIRFNVPFIINGGNITPQIVTELFSTKNLGEIIKSIIQYKLNIITSNIIEVNFSKINNSITVQKYIQNGYNDYLYGFKVFLSEKYKLVITGNKKIKAYYRKDEFNEIKDNIKLNEIINYFKEKRCNFDIPNFD